MAAPSVLYVLKRFPRLSETFILRELLALEDGGLRVGVDALLPPEAEPRHAQLEGLNADVRYLPRRPRLHANAVRQPHARVASRAPLRWARLALRARRAGGWRRFLQAGVVADRVRREGFDHVHAHFATAATEVARDAATLSGVPFTVTAHAKDVFHEDNRGLLPRRVAGARALVTVSAFNAGHLRRELPGMEVHQVPNAVPLGREVDLRPGGPVLCVARLVPKKGVDVLIDAVALLRGEVPGVRVEVVGGGPLGDELAERARRASVSDCVTFLGPRPQDEVQAAFERCSMVVLPARVDERGDREGMPTVLVEAMARGVPVISTSIVGIPELIQDDETGLLVPPDDPVALAAAMTRLLRDPALARRLGRAGRRLVGERFDPTHSRMLLERIFAGPP